LNLPDSIAADKTPFQRLSYYVLSPTHIPVKGLGWLTVQIYTFFLTLMHFFDKVHVNIIKIKDLRKVLPSQNCQGKQKYPFELFHPSKNKSGKKSTVAQLFFVHLQNQYNMHILSITH